MTGTKRVSPLLSLIVGYVLLWMVGCSPETTLSGRWESREISRSISPDGKYEAVIVSENGGATTSLVMNVYLTKRGGVVQAERDYNRVFTSDHTRTLSIKWREINVLEVHFEEARIHHFRNFWNLVEIRLLPSKPDYSLPASDRRSFE